MRTCTYKDCDRPHLARGLCSAHDARMRKGIAMDKPIRKQRKTIDILARDEQGRKQCRVCLEWLPEKAYSASHTRDKLQGACRECYKWSHIERTYGLNKDGYEDMLASQGGGCAICNRTPDNGVRFHIDHDHSCCPRGKTCGECVRGILCGECNKGLGLFFEDETVLRSAIAYVQTHTK